RADIFNYIEFFYNRVRHHGHNDGLSPEAFERRYFSELAAV
ncbi:MAG: IS3 family transposase, partial [Pseudomonadota bacterium]